MVAVFAMTALAGPSSKNIRNQGQMKKVNVSVYWDSACTNATTSIDWGTLTPGTANSKTFYVRNEGNTPLVLSMTILNWNPNNASNCLSLTWNLQGQTINSASTKTATLTLTATADTTGIASFSFDVTIAGTGQ
jgi:hypothetical protein